MTLNSTMAGYKTRTSVRLPFSRKTKRGNPDAVCTVGVDVMMNEFESPAKSIATLPETDDELTTTKPKPRARAQQRPPPKPLTGGASTSGRFNHSGSGAGAGFMTQAERSKIDAKEKKAAEQDCFEFLRDLKDVSALPRGCVE